MIIVAIIIYIIGYGFFWFCVNETSNPAVTNFYKFTIPLLWPLYMTWTFIYDSFNLIYSQIKR